MWNPISIDQFVKIHLKNNPNDNEKVLKVRIEAALDKYGRRHIDEMDPQKISGIFDDNGYEIRQETIKIQPLCLTCIKNNSDNWDFIIDRWGLFNPPGVGPFDKDPDDDIPFHGFDEDPEE